MGSLGASPAGGETVVVVAVSALPASLLPLSAAAGTAPRSDGLESVVLVASGTDAVVSSLKSLTVGGGTFAGSGRGIAASIASSAALARGASPCATAAVADTVRKVAATAISTRSNPPRFFTQSRIPAPLGRICPGMEQLLVLSVQLWLKRRPRRLEPIRQRLWSQIGSCLNGSESL